MVRELISSVDAEKGRSGQVLERILRGWNTVQETAFGTDGSAMALVGGLLPGVPDHAREAAILEVGGAKPGLASWMFNQRPSALPLAHWDRSLDLDDQALDRLLAPLQGVRVILVIGRLESSSSSRAGWFGNWLAPRRAPSRADWEGLEGFRARVAARWAARSDSPETQLVAGFWCESSGRLWLEKRSSPDPDWSPGRTLVGSTA